MKYTLTSSTWGNEEIKAMQEVIKSGWFTMRKRVDAFEKKFADYFGKKYAIMVNSGSSANLVAIASLFYRKNNPLRKGDEVIVPCVSWATTYYPLQQYGLKLRFVDIDLKTLNMDVGELKKAVSRNTKMVVTVSILGNPCKFDEITEVCRKNNIVLFEDNCESMGAKFNARFTGTFGLLNTFSTFYSHHISTMEGGLILTDDIELYYLMQSLRNHGWTRDQKPDSPIYNKSKDDFFEAYRFILPGYNVRPGELHAAIGHVQLDKLEKFIKIRRRNAQHFVSLFKGDERFIIQEEIGESSWFCFTMIVRPELKYSRKKVLDLLRKAGIEHRIITGGNFLRHDVIKYFDYTAGRSTNADIAHDRGFFVGNHPFDIRDEIDYLHKTLRKL